MKLRVLGPNQTEVEVDGVVVLFSYNTPVAASVGDDFFVTEKKYSTTTTKHINSWLAGMSAKDIEKRSQSFFDSLFTLQEARKATGGAK